MKQPVIVALGVVGVLAMRAARAETDPIQLGFVAIKSVTASSTFADPHDAYAPVNIVTYEQRGTGIVRAWCEGKPDEGIGEAVTITLAEPTYLESISIAAGVWRSRELFDANNQITKLDVIADGKTQTIVPGAFGATTDWVEAPLKRRVSTIVLRVAAVKRGKMNDSCLAAVNLNVRGNRLVPIVGGDVAQLAALRTAVDALQKSLDDPARAGLQPQLEFPFATQDYFAAIAGRNDQRVSAAIFKLATWADVVRECKEYAAAVAAAPPDTSVSLRGCPGPASVGDRLPQVRTTKPGWVVIAFPSQHDIFETWTLHWSGKRWRLTAIGSE